MRLSIVILVISLIALSDYHTYWTVNEKESRRRTTIKVGVSPLNRMEEPDPAMNTITQDMKFRESLMKFALGHGVTKASRRYNKSRSYIYFG